MIYQAKKDSWLYGLVWGAVLLTCAAGVLVYFASDAAVGRELIGSGVAAAAVTLVLTYPLNYELNGTHLVARCGVMRWSVPLGSVEEARPVRSWLSAPAWSSDRLRVSYREGPNLKTLDIAPEDKLRFMADLVDAAPGLELRDGRVVRVP
jgi:Bacterial PH domain